MAFHSDFGMDNFGMLWSQKQGKNQQANKKQGSNMKVRKVLGFTLTLMATAGLARAQHIWDDPSAWANGILVYDQADAPTFSANELSFDMFGSYTAGEEKIEDIFKTNIKHGTWGGGVGLNYFLTREIGLGADMNMSANGGKLVDQAVGSLILRLPFDSVGLAPYVLGGGGRSFDPEGEWLGDAGVGLEWRMNHVAGIFSDVRYEWLEHTSDRALFRAGIRLVF
jgi:hypothetical protein